MLVQRQSAGLERIVETLQWRGYTVRQTVEWDSPTYQAIARRGAAIAQISSYASRLKHAQWTLTHTLRARAQMVAGPRRGARSIEVPLPW